MTITLKVAGGTELEAALRHMASAGADRETSIRALIAAATPIARRAASLCQRGEEGPPHLADNIMVTPMQYGEPAVRIGPPRKFFYDYFLEYGTRHSRAYPFYRPALDAEAAGAIIIAGTTYWNLLMGQVPAGFITAGEGEE